MKEFFLGVTLLLGAVAAQANDGVPAAEPVVPLAIHVSTMPPTGPGGEYPIARIAGSVTGAIPERTSLVIYAFAGDRWWVQPDTRAPFTGVASDGNWSAWTHLGRRYAVLLVSSEFVPRPTCPELPASGGSVLARVDVP